MSAPPSKSQRIDLWRHEVALASSATAETSTPPSSPRAQKRTSFLSRLLRSKSSESSNREEAFESTAMYGAIMPAGDKAAARAAKLEGNGKDRDRDAGDCGGEGECMAIEDVSVSSSSPEGRLIAKQERLDRAARLLGKDGGRMGEG
jgi:hypothetical protein